MAGKNLIANTPAEGLNISPEGLEIANTYLEVQDINKTALKLGVEPEFITKMLARKEIKAYVDSIFFNLGYNNRYKLRGIMDKLINDKMKEMEEAGTTSKKDIVELLALSLKITQAETQRLIEENKLAESQIRTQTNIQINGADNYSNLIEKLLGKG